MHGLTSDRFLRQFAGKRKNQRKPPTPKGVEKPESAEASDDGPNNRETQDIQGKEAAANTETDQQNNIAQQKNDPHPAQQEAPGGQTVRDETQGDRI